MIYGIILAAGKSRRFKDSVKKQFVKLNNKVLFEYSVDKFLNIDKIDKILLVIDKVDKKSSAINSFLKKYNSYILSGKISIIIGGKERYDSVYNSLLYIIENFSISKNDKVLIHDSARPVVDSNDIEKLISCTKKYKVITLGSRIYDTIKSTIELNKNIRIVNGTVDRSRYSLVSTPQAFELSTLVACYSKFYNLKNKKDFTDDIQIIERFSKIKPYILITDNLNIKITTQKDLNMVKYII